MTRSWRLYTAVFLQGMSLLALEITLSRVLAVAMWHHFASLVISVAMLGMTLGAMAVYLGAGGIGSGSGFLPRSLLGFGSSAAAVFGFFWLVTAFPAFGYRFFRVFHHQFFEPFGAGTSAAGEGMLWVNLLVLTVLFGLPFVFGGAFIARVLGDGDAPLGSLYAADLLGAGAGCFLAVVLLNLADGITVLLVAALPILAAAILLAPPGGTRRLAWGAAAAAAVMALVNLVHPFARFPFVRGTYQPGILHERWNAVSRVVVYPLAANQEENSWGQSRVTGDQLPPQMGLVVDDTGYTTLTRFPEDGNLDFMRHNLIALPYVVRPRARALLIGPGGGRDILAALAMGAGPVTAVEINPLVVEAVDRTFGEFSGRLYGREGVTTHVTDARTFIRRSRETYDVIGASLVYGRLPSSAGAFTLTEEQLYTKESFREYLEDLAPDGLVAMTRFIYERRIQRIVSLGLAVLAEGGAAEPRRHFFIAAERGLATILLGKRAFSREETGRLEEWCRDLGFEILYSPDRPGTGAFHRLLDAPDPAAFLSRSPVDLSPPTDDRPYFYYLLRPADFWRVMVGRGGQEYEDRAIILVRDALGILALFSTFLLILPLLLRGGGRGRGVPVAAVAGYFGGLGIGFITVEIILLKVLVLHLGHPILALSVVLAAVLLSSGLGSLLSPYLLAGASRGRIALWLAGTLLAVLLLLPAAGPVLGGTMTWGLAGRVAVAVGLIALPGVPMGACLPAGLQVLRRRDPSLVPWAFGVNGVFSVLGAMVVMLLALNYGYRLTWALAPLGYGLSLLSLAGLGGDDRGA
jgi:predicted membrane-bound spermidine synthase